MQIEGVTLLQSYHFGVCHRVTAAAKHLESYKMDPGLYCVILIYFCIIFMSKNAQPLCSNIRILTAK